MESNTIKEALSLNEAYLKGKIGEGFDMKYRHFNIPAFGDCEALIVFVTGLIDTRVVDETVLEALIKYSQKPDKRLCTMNGDKASELLEQGVFTTAVVLSKRWTEVCDAVMEGDTVLFIDNCPTALILTTRKYEGRSVNEPQTESEVKGPRDGFTENIQTNAALVRRRVRDYGLRFDNMKIGERSKTVVLVAYIEGLVNDNLLKEVKSRLLRIKTDALLASEQIEELIQDSPNSPFPMIQSTERPDKASSAILEGRIVILMDNTPFVLIMPVVFWQFLISSGDYYEHYLYSSFIRWVRFIAMFLSVSASSLYVLLTSYHQEMLPTALALKVASGRNGVPFPSVLEAALMEVILEIMKEAGLRMPKPIGQTVSIIGTLVIGQAAVSAGLVSPLMIIVIAVAAISSYAVPSYGMSNTFRIMRFPILIVTAFFGLLGFLASVIAILFHLMSLRSFGTPYFAPLTPYEGNAAKAIFSRLPWWRMNKRPEFLRAKDSVKQPSNLKPKPPAKK